MAQRGGITDKTFVQAYGEAKIKQLAGEGTVVLSLTESYEGDGPNERKTHREFNFLLAGKEVSTKSLTRIDDALSKVLEIPLDRKEEAPVGAADISTGSFKRGGVSFVDSKTGLYHEMNIPDGLHGISFHGTPAILKTSIERNDPELAKQVTEELSRQKQ